jgi:phage portal protein BeeE
VNLWQELRGRRDGLPIGGPDAYVGLLNNSYSYGGGFTQTLTDGRNVESIGSAYAQVAGGGYANNGVVFSCMAVRQHVFSAVRFQWQRIRQGRPSDLFGSADLRLLEEPWPGGTTQDLRARLIQDADLAGNSYWTRDSGELVRLRPDWVEIVLEPRTIRGARVGWRRIGFLYYEGGRYGENRDNPAVFSASEVAHFAPTPDPLASWRGMSWLTPVLREIESDALMGRHKRKFFENGATPNMVVKHPPEATPDTIKRFRDVLDAGHAGVDRAYKPLHIGGGVDVTVVGRDFQQIDFKAVQGHGETRIAAAAGVPPVIVGLSEGLESATYSNYAQARRRFADGTMHPLWQNVSGSLGRVVPVPSLPSGGAQPPGSLRLFYDARDVPFLREDEKDAAEIAEMKARTIRTYVDGGYTPDSAKAAVESGDEGLLEHTGWFSVQLQQPGGAGTADGAPAATDNVRDVVEMIQKIYLGVGIVLTADEARALLNRAGADLTGSLPPLPAPAAPAATPAPSG